MPRLIEVPNVGQVEFPDDMSDSQIARAIERDILKMEPLPQQQGSSIGNFARGVGRGLMDTGQGIKQIGLGGLGALGVVSPNAQSDYTKQVDAERAAYEQSPVGQSDAAQWGRLAGGILPYLAVPGGVAGGLATRMATGALANAGLGYTQYVPEGGSRAMNTGVAALLGGAAPAVIAPVAKGLNAIKGGAIDPAIQAIMDQGKKYGIRLGAADVSPSPVLKGIDQGLEEVPLIGTRGFRAAQNEEGKVAAQGLASQAQNQMLNTQFENVDQLMKVAKSGGPRAKQAQQLLDDVANSGDDWQKIIDTSGNLKLFGSKLQADQKYKLVEDLASKYGTVGLQDTSEILGNALKQAEGSVLPDKALLSTLGTLQNNLGKGGLNYSQLRQARSDLGSMINDAYTGKNAAVGTQGAAALQSVRGAITRDMDTFAQKNGPELSKAWRDADAYYRGAVAPYKDAQLAKALKGGAPDEIYSKFIQSGGTEGGKGTTRASKLYDALDPKGQAAVRYGMVKNAFEKASNADMGSFSPAKFASEFDRIAAAKGVFFKGAAKAEIDGFKNLMRHIERSNVAVNKPETGVKNIPYLVGGAVGAGAYFDPASTMAVLSSVYGLKTLMTTPAGRNFLLSSSKLKAGSPQMQKAVDNFIKAAQLTAVKSGVDSVNAEQER